MILETSGTTDIKPKGTDGQDKNLIPNYNDGDPAFPALGTSASPWFKLYIDKEAFINKGMHGLPLVFIVYGDSGSTDANVLMGASATSHRVYLACSAMMSTDSDARTILAQENDEADIAVASFKQRNDSAPFLDFEGAVAADASKNISSGNGNGSVVGPQAKNTAAMGWTFDKMVKQRITPEAPAEPYDVWVPGFQPEV